MAKTVDKGDDDVLDEKDIQILRQMFAEQEARINTRMDARFAEQEARIDKRFAEQEARFNARMDARFAEQEARIDKRFAEQEARMDAKMDQKIEASENRLFAYLESKIEPQIKLLAEGQQALLEKMAPKDRINDLEARVSTVEHIVTQHSKDIKNLKEAI